MDKTTVIELILAKLESELEAAKEASLEAAEYATHEESKADSKWDTQGLEASYLAAGQAGQVVEIGKSIQVVRGYLEEGIEHPGSVESGCLVEMKVGRDASWLFIANGGGGVSVKVEQQRVMVVTPQSPIAQRIIGKQAGDTFVMPNGNQGVVDSIL